jgi:hypothetical protein
MSLASSSKELHILQKQYKYNEDGKRLFVDLNVICTYKHLDRNANENKMKSAIGRAIHHMGRKMALPHPLHNCSSSKLRAETTSFFL